MNTRASAYLWNRRARALAAALVTSLVSTACLDFADPVSPQLAAPAFTQINMRAFDTGSFQVDGFLQPGRDSAGFQRVVQSPFIQAAGFVVAPQSLGERGVRNYSSTFVVPRGSTAGPFDLIVPDVRDVGVIPPLRWYGLRRLDPDTLFVTRGADITLRMDTIPEQSVPATVARQWFLEVRAGFRSFRLSGDGVPPSTLRIPAEFIPPATDNRVFISLIYFQSGQRSTPGGTYIASVVLDVRLNWVVVLRSPP